MTEPAEVVALYGAVEVLVIDPGRGRGRFSIGTFTAETIGALPAARLAGYVARGDGVYFTPAPGPLLAVFVDDPGRPDDRAALVVQTSAAKRQAHYRLAAPADDASAAVLQRRLLAETGGDIGAVALRHPRRLPGFDNPKYQPPHPVRIVSRGPGALDCQTITAPQEQQRTTDAGPRLRRAPAKRRTDFETGDASRTDMRYTHYLIACGWTDEEIAAALLAERPDLAEKHDPDDYISRTISKARTFRHN